MDSVPFSRIHERIFKKLLQWYWTRQRTITRNGPSSKLKRKMDRQMRKFRRMKTTRSERTRSKSSSTMKQRGMIRQPALKRRKTNPYDSGDGKQASSTLKPNTKVKPSVRKSKTIIQFPLSDKAIDTSHDPAKERDLIVKSFKGYGPKTVDIVFRRVQVDWQEMYPFADAATVPAARAVGLNVDDAEGLRKVVDEAIEETDGEKERLMFATVVDILVYLRLKKKTDQVEKQLGVT